MLSGLFLGACSERTLYDNIQDNRESRCYELPAGPQQQSCLDEARGLDYDSYQRELKKLD